MRFKSNKKLISTLLCMMLIVVMALTIVACGANNQKDSVQSSTNVQNTEENEGNILGEGQTKFIFTVVDKDGKVAYAVSNPANGYGGPSGTGYYAHPDYAADYTTNPAFNILEGYGPWTPEDSQSSTKFEIVVPEGGFIITSQET